MMKIKKIPVKYTIPIVIVGSLISAVIFSGKSDIKDNFCGVHINYQYCKCAFHNQYCSNIGMSKRSAKTYVYSKYNEWKKGSSDKEKYGIIEKDGKLYLKSKPGKVLSIKTSDLPGWARGQIATVGATIITVGTADAIAEGDSNVTLDGLPIARQGDGTVHGGKIVEGSKRIFVNGKPVAYIGGQATDPMAPGGIPNLGGPIVSNAN